MHMVEVIHCKIANVFNRMYERLPFLPLWGIGASM